MNGSAGTPVRPVAWISGANGGLGRAMVSAFLSSGYRVAACSRQSATWEQEGQNILPVTADVTDSDSVDRALAAAVNAWGRIDCAIHNAGVAIDGLLTQFSEEEWDRVLEVNLKGAFHMARAVARMMARQRSGHLIFLSSYAGRCGARGQAAYAAAKAGLFGLSESVAREFGSRNVRANVVLPGVLATRMTASLTTEQMDSFAKANALGRINSVEEVARFVAFLATTENISGQVFQLDSRIAPWT